MSLGFHHLAAGDQIEMKGPLGSFVWQGANTALWKGVPRKIQEIGLVCGGSGTSFEASILRASLILRCSHSQVSPPSSRSYVQFFAIPQTPRRGCIFSMQTRPSVTSSVVPSWNLSTPSTASLGDSESTTSSVLSQSNGRKAKVGSRTHY